MSAKEMMSEACCVRKAAKLTAMHQPSTGVICAESKRGTAARRDHDGISAHRVRLPFDDGRIDRRVIARHILTLMHHLEVVPVQVEGVD